ncbi:glycoside hydrolase family 78 protein [Mucilaginibacter aquaedulcis]|uniref:glycoside hydrolase family 78 protein n=1 Tax=Mucilaginibacter aquaedulcis TaxID=1187081 RepID=UPI0025B29184|nr:glycoside hydrolase family 78 protein [Mucilaginibacter aquaedulcis]MDN3549401.1 glycoside hydrolase family 78 protein [Mucilaginibacter aquaedulcis]
MKRIFLYLLLMFPVVCMAQTPVAESLTCDYLTNPMGIDALHPRLSWKINTPQRNTLQQAYNIRVATDVAFSPSKTIWNTGKVKADSSVLITYNGTALKSGTRYYWQVKVWDNHGHASAWSKPAYFETGLLLPTDWKATWMLPKQDTLRKIPAVMLRKQFTVSKKIVSARAYATAHGLYELHLNGKRVGDQQLTPGWTEYKKRLQYQVYDITPLLQQGDNVVGAMLGDGWFRGTTGFASQWAVWGKKLALLCQLQITYADGSVQYINSDGSWKSTQNGPITLDGIYDGENYDARKEITGWDIKGFNDATWQPVSEVTYDNKMLVGVESVPVHKIQEIKPIAIFKSPKGTQIIDFGQNLTGWVSFKVSGQAGQTVNIRHAEVLDKFGEFYTANLRSATACINYTLKGGGIETFEPHFTFMGFRYIAVEGYPGKLKPENFTAVVVHSDMPVTGEFTCSDTMINKLQHNIQWGQKGNFLDIPTDCPQRDERLGWTGDAQVFSRTAAFNMQVAPFFAKWMKDVAADQFKGGGIPFVVPDNLPTNESTSAGWGDVAVIVPWTMYQVYADKGILQTQYPSMKAYVDYITKKAGDKYIWHGGSLFGDWLFYRPGIYDFSEPNGYTNPDLIATAFYAYSSKLLSQAAGVLGNTADEKKYNDIFESVKKAFIHNYITPTGRVFADSQTGYVLALKFDLVPNSLKAKAAAYLVEDVRSRNNHLSTGFLGTPYLCQVLSQNGYSNVAYDLLLQKTYPSWLYPVKMGATTIWERWDGIKTDSTFQDKSMNSFNHYSYGAVGDWMYQQMAGLQIGAPGYKNIVIKPQPNHKFSFAKATFETMYGQVLSSWEVNNGTMHVHVKIPANSTADITLPAARPEDVKADGKSITGVFNVTGIKNEEGATIKLGSGDYTFSYPWIVVKEKEKEKDRAK